MAAKFPLPPMTNPTFNCLNEITLSLIDVIKPPERLSITESAARYRYLNNQGSFVGFWRNTTTPYLVAPTNMLMSPDHEAVIFVGAAQTGKGLALDERIATPTGWTTVGALRVGDVIFSEQGQVTSVKYLSPITNRDCYRITFDDGSSVVADDVHRWGVNDQRANDPYVLLMRDTKALASSYKINTSKGTTRYRYSVPNTAPLDLPNVALPIDPYVLGFWLGDGSANSGLLTICKKDFSEVLENLSVRGFKLHGHGDVKNGCIEDVALRNPQDESVRTLIARNGLRNNKHIPSAYLRASIVQRRELLRGLLDSDGSVEHNGRITFSQSNVKLFNQVVELVRSLGHKPMLDVKIPKYTYCGEEREGLPSHRLAFSVVDSSECFGLSRHVAKHKKHTASVKTRPTHSGRRFVRNIEKINSVPTRCLTVDAPSHLFLVGDAMIPTHNTDALILNWTLYSVKVDPMDIIIYNPTTAAARDFSLRRIDRLNRHSPEIGKLLMKGRTADNRLDKHYSTGTFLSLSHPSQTELAGKPIPRVALTDYDRMPEDVDGDGSPFDLASKRTTSFGSFAMTLAESSPSRPLENPRWIAKSAHEAPPTTGILALYNRGDRRRWYWPCPHCGEHFEGEFHHLQWDETMPTVLQQAESVHMVCPNNGCVIREDSKFEMNLEGVWLRDGQAFNKDGQIIGVGARNKIASFWMKGVAAAFASWPKLVSTYLAALQEYEQTGSEEALKKFYNTDLAEIYLPKDGMSERTPEQLKSRAEFLGEKVVPEGVRFLIGTVDVQKNAFVVQIHGISPGTPYDICVVDRFTILKSNRLDDDGEHSWVKPATYLEDWDILIEEVINKEYPLADGSGRKMLMRYTVCDSGGKAGVTANAYQFYRNLKERNLHGRFHLVKGDSKPGQSRTRITYPDASKKDKYAAARGDVPVLMLNSNVLKDQLNGRLDCMAVGKGMWRFPDWLPDWFFMELCSERRTNKGWENPSHSRNEAWDLGYYCLGICASRILMIEKFDWSSPPRWAAEWDQNDMVRAATESPRFAVTVKKDYDFSKFGESIG